MKPPLAHVSQTALAALAAAASIWLSIFVLPGSGVQPIPLLPAIGSAAGHVVSEIAPPPAPKPVAKKKSAVRFLPVLAPPPAVAAVVRAAVTHPGAIVHAQPAHRARPHAPAPVSRPKHAKPVHAAPPPIPAAPTVGSPHGGPMGKANGYRRNHGLAPISAPVAKGNGQGKAHGHSHRRGTPPGQAKKAPAAPAAAASVAPAASAKSNGHGQGNSGQPEHGNQGHGGGGKK